MAYAADLITVLKSLFVQVTQLSSSEAPKVTWQVLNEVYDTHKTSDDRRKIYRRIGADFQQKQQFPGRDEEVFRSLFQSLGFDSVSPHPGAGSSPNPGAGPSNLGAGPSLNPGAGPSPNPGAESSNPEAELSNPGAGPSTGPAGKPFQEEPVPPPRSNCLQVWSRRLICCSTPP